MTIEDIIDLMVAAIKAAETLAGDNIFSFRAIPTRADALPIVIIQLPEADLVSQGRGTPQYTATYTVPIVGRIAVDFTQDDPLGLGIQQAMSAFRLQIQMAILNNTQIMRGVQQIARVTSRAKFNAENQQRLGELQMAVAVETYVGPGEMHDIGAVDLTGITLSSSLKTTAGDTPFAQDLDFDLTA